MGCDIHVYCEKFYGKEYQATKGWKNVDHWTPNAFYDKKEKGNGAKWQIIPAYRRRDYSLFYQLAKVRPQYSDGAFMADPKGMPEGCSKIVRKEFEYWDEDGHSHSWATLKELLDFHYGNENSFLQGFIDSVSERFFSDDFKRIIDEKYKNDSESLNQYRIVFWFDN